MNGDLSLSQSLGGLRIANPDSDDEAADHGTSSESSPSSAPATTTTTTTSITTKDKDKEDNITNTGTNTNVDNANNDHDINHSNHDLYSNNDNNNNPGGSSSSSNYHSNHDKPAASPSSSSAAVATVAINCPPPSSPEADRPTISSHSSGSTIRDLQRPRGLSQISANSGSGSYQSANTNSSEQDVSLSSRDGPQDTYSNLSRAYHAPSNVSDPQLHPQRVNRQAYDTHSQYSQGSQYSGRMRDPNDPRTTATRPMSLYNHANASSSSQISHSSYRYNDNNIQPPVPSMGISRSTSRAAAAAMAGQVPIRQASRSYRGEAQMAGPSPGMLPRRSSRRGPAGYTAAAGSGAVQGSPYAMEGGPLPSSEEWKEKGAAVSTRQEIDANGRPVQKVIKKGVKDFNFGRTLGEGSYSTVLAATDRHTMREYAVKVLDKRHIIKEKKVKYVNIEKDALNRLTEHPGVVRLYYTFQDERSLYFVLDLANGGELLGVLKKMGTFDEDCARFYSAQILDSIAYMHSKGIIHRDLKPENVLLDDNMHTKITDFGTAKILDIKANPNGGSGNEAAGDPLDGVEQDRANSFVGTAEYVSPELLTDKNACKASDLWAFGCIVYQLIVGRPPFKAANEYQTFQKIVALDYTFPDGFPTVARDLVERLLVLDPSQRLPIDHIMSHAFFDGIQWGKGLWKQKAPRLRSYMPPPSAPINLNTANGSTTNLPNIPGIAMAPSPSQPMMPQQQAVQSSPQQLSPPPPLQQQPRPQLRAITELAPPSQLDIDWSPVLTRNNERILKLGNLNVLSAPAPHSPITNKPGGDGEEKTPNRKFSRFFGGSTTKKRERLVMITSSARLILAAAGGGEKKAKTEVNLLAPGTTWKGYVDGRGLTVWSVDTVSLSQARPKPSGCGY